MLKAKLRQEWLMYGRLNVDLINSQRSIKDQVSPVGLYPYFEKPPVQKATAQDELNLVEQLKHSTWLTIKMTS